MRHRRQISEDSRRETRECREWRERARELRDELIDTNNWGEVNILSKFKEVYL